MLGTIAVAFIVGAALLVSSNKNNDSEVASNTEATAQSAAETSIETGSIKSLIAAGENQQCTFKSNEQDAETDGTMYLSGGKMRGDFAIDANGTKTSSHMIYDGTTGYVWMDGQVMGFKMSLDANSQTTDKSQSIDPNKNYEFNCGRWSVDNSKFEIPAGIQFSEMPALPSGSAGASGSADTKAVQQAVCNNLPEPAKAQCLAGIK